MRSRRLRHFEQLESRRFLAVVHCVTHEVAGAHFWSAGVVAADVDGDGDADAVVGAAHNLSLFENMDGHGDFSRPRAIGATFPILLSSGDIDGDGDLDVIAAETRTVKVFENSDGKGTF